MKQNLTNVPEVKLNDVEHFYVMGSRHKDGILGVENQKVDLKELGGGADIETLVNSEDFVAGVLDVVGNADKGLYLTFGQSSPSEAELLDYNLPLTQVKLAELLNYIKDERSVFKVEMRYTYTGEGSIPDGFPTEPQIVEFSLAYDRDENATPYISLRDDHYYTWEDNNTLIEYSPMVG